MADANAQQKTRQVHVYPHHFSRFLNRDALQQPVAEFFGDDDPRHVWLRGERTGDTIQQQQCIVFVSRSEVNFLYGTCYILMVLRDTWTSRLVGVQVRSEIRHSNILRLIDIISRDQDLP